MTLAVVRNIGSAGTLRTDEDVAAFEQELVDQYALALAAAGLTDAYVASCRRVIFEFAESLSGLLWSASCDDADRFLTDQRRLGRAASTRATKAVVLAQFYAFVIARYQGDIHALTGWVVEQPIDEFNKPANVLPGRVRVPPSETEVDELFAHCALGWPTHASTCRRRGTISRRRCGDGWGCGSTRR